MLFYFIIYYFSVGSINLIRVITWCADPEFRECMNWLRDEPFYDKFRSNLTKDMFSYFLLFVVSFVFWPLNFNIRQIG